MTRILVVDDEPTLVASIGFNLQKEGFEVLTAEDGKLALATFRESKPDLIILDLMLGEMNGLEVCRVLRGESAVPIIILSARASDVDKVLGLELGADDYMTKPFSMHELMARVRAHLRRKNTSAPREDDVLVAGPLTIDFARREVIKGEGKIDLKPKEFDLLAYLMKNRARVLTRPQIMQAVWGYDGFDTTRTVDVHVGRLRSKIEDSPEHPRLILTMRGYGYSFAG
jgi:DNA-binding response OmpR family regulator